MDKKEVKGKSKTTVKAKTVVKENKTVKTSNGSKKPFTRKDSSVLRHERAEANWQNTVVKTKVIGFFARHMPDHAKQREALSNFLDKMKKQKNADMSELNKVRDGYGQIGTTKNIRTIRPRSAEVRRKSIPNPDTPTWKPYEIKPGSICALCDEVFPAFHENEAIPCRVCDDVFHEKCLGECGDLHASDIININKAKCNTGWSCPKCANISLLLSTDEVTKMTYDFERVDINQDGCVTLAEYLRFHSRRGSLANSRGVFYGDNKERLTREYHQVDQDGDGLLDWWEFVNHNSKMYLANKDKYELVKMLTEKELVSAKATFSMLDVDGDGKVKEYEAVKAYKKWYRQFEKPRKSLADEVDTEADSDSLDLHASVSTMCIMDSDRENVGIVEWEDYILDQALYIICARPNINMEAMAKHM